MGDKILGWIVVIAVAFVAIKGATGNMTEVQLTDETTKIFVPLIGDKTFSLPFEWFWDSLLK